jgi:hypothetical protein
LFLIIAAMTIAIIVVALQLRDDQGSLDAEAAAVKYVAGGVAQDTRREDDRWEVDVVRPDGSMVQVNLGRDLELTSLDEELGPAGTLAATVAGLWVLDRTAPAIRGLAARGAPGGR